LPQAALPAPDAAQFDAILCLPTAPDLPTVRSGDFGMSPFYGQLSNKPLLAHFILLGDARPKAQ
jgi:hypothetical protein